jgi:hypothetical protein
VKSLVALSLLATLGCNQPSSSTHLTPMEQARRDSLARAWDRYRDSAFRGDSALASASRMPPLVVRAPVVIGFTPLPRWNPAVRELEYDSVSLQFRADSSVLRRLADDAGFTYVTRYGPYIAIQDPRYNSARAVTVGADSVGVVLVAPGAPALTHYGPVHPGVMQRALERYAEHLGRRPSRAPSI